MFCWWSGLLAWPAYAKILISERVLLYDYSFAGLRGGFIFIYFLNLFEAEKWKGKLLGCFVRRREEDGGRRVESGGRRKWFEDAWIDYQSRVVIMTWDSLD